MKKLLLMALLASAPIFAYTKTTVQATGASNFPLITDAGGNPMTCTGTIAPYWNGSSQGFTEPDGTPVKGVTSFAITSGALSIALYPNDVAIPTGGYYQVQYACTTPSTHLQEIWVVPSNGPVAVGAIAVTSAPPAGLTFLISQLSPVGFASNSCLGIVNGVWGPLPCSATGLPDPGSNGIVTRTGAGTTGILSYTPANAASNLSDLVSASAARTNLGLGSAATQASSAFDAAGAAAAAQAASDPSGSAATAQAASLQKSSNLSDLANAATARTNLGLGSAATQPSSAFEAALAFTPLSPSNNLSELSSDAAARSNLGLAIGTNVEAWSADLDALSTRGLTGNGTKVATGTGTYTSGDCATFDAFGNLADNGSPCGAGSGNVNGSGLTSALFVQGGGGSNISISAYGPSSFDAAGAAAARAATGSCPSNQFGTATTTGGFTCAQPAFSNISGTVAATQLPNPSATTLGGIKSVAAVTSNWVSSINTLGAPQLSQPAFTDITGTLLKAQQVASTVYIDQSNTYSAGTQDFTGSAHFLPKSGIIASIPGTCTTGEVYMATDQTPAMMPRNCVGSNTFDAFVYPASVDSNGNWHWVANSGASISANGVFDGTLNAASITAGTSCSVCLAAVNLPAQNAPASPVTGDLWDFGGALQWNDGTQTLTLNSAAISTPAATFTVATKSAAVLIASSSSGSNTSAVVVASNPTGTGPSVVPFSVGSADSSLPLNLAGLGPAGSVSFGGFPGATGYTNAGTTGTTQYNLTSLTAGTAVQTTGGATSGVIGVCLLGCGTSGTASIATIPGTKVPVQFDNTSTAGHIVTISSTAGQAHDFGTSEPTDGSQVLGYVTAGGTTAAARTIIWQPHFSTNSAAFANLALSNLSGVSINAALLAQTGIDLGSTVKPFRNLYLSGAGTYGTNYLEQTGTPTAARTITWADASGTPALTANNLSVFASTTSAQLLGVLSDPTGTGSAVFATSPTITTPALGNPTFVDPSNSNAVLMSLSGVASAVNYLTITNATAGAPTVALSTSGSSTVRNLALFSAGDSSNVTIESDGQPVMQFINTSASNTDYFQAAGSNASGANLKAAGGTNVNLILTPKGSGLVSMAGPSRLLEGAAPTCAATYDSFWADSTAHRLKECDGTGAAVQLVHSGVDVNASDQVANLSNVTNASLPNSGLAGSIAASKLVGTDIATLGTITSGTWSGTTITNSHGGTGNTVGPNVPLVGNVTSGTVAANTLSFLGFGVGTIGTAESSRSVIMPLSSTISNLCVRIIGNQPSGGSLVFTARLDGVDQTLTVSFAANATGPSTVCDSTHSFTVAATHLLSIGAKNNDGTNVSATIAGYSVISQQ